MTFFSFLTFILIVFSRSISKLSLDYCDQFHNTNTITVQIYSYDVLSRNDCMQTKSLNSANPIRFKDRFQLSIRQRGYSPATVKTYTDWALRFIRHHKFQTEDEMRIEHVESFLTFLAEERGLTKNSQKTVLSALVFLYREFLGISTKGLNFSRAYTRARVPIVLNTKEAKALFIQLSGSYRLLAKLMYGCGFRLAESVNIRVGHVDLEQRHILVLNGKGSKSRYLPIPNSLTEAVSNQINIIEQLHQEDISAGFGFTSIANQGFVSEKSVSKHLHDQFLFPHESLYSLPESDIRFRHHVDPQKVRRHIKDAASKAGIRKNVTCHTLRHSYATEMLRQGFDIRSVQSLLGHDSVRTTEIYTHIVSSDFRDIVSLADLMSQ